MTNPPILVITGLGGYFILNFLQKSGYNTILTEKMEELFITKIKESPLTGAPNHNMTSQTIRCYVLYVTSYNTLLLS